VIANYLHIPTFSRHGQRANLRPLAHAAKQPQLVTFGPFMRVPGPGFPAKDNPPARFARFQKLFTVRGGHFRGRLNLHQVCDWNGSIGEILSTTMAFLINSLTDQRVS
jgi:hypothetical protein